MVHQEKIGIESTARWPVGKEAVIEIKMNKSSSLLDLRQIRKSRLENQTRFWEKFGVTQSSGSRFEMGVELPLPVIILLNLYLKGAINDLDLEDALADNQFAIQKV